MIGLPLGHPTRCIINFNIPLDIRHANVKVSDIHDFLINDAHVSPQIVRQYINLSAAELEDIQAQMLQLAFQS
ncbi:hypothetical protein [Limosilactobacillus difficilis]|uniref:hypothetical protein n=1 Tax=Limosilactobacillus difficilis TaxID=2991838 RepID=UPI0024B9782F|nr:hypothetical protein [Limosilactobacillus difficilis]